MNPNPNIPASGALGKNTPRLVSKGQLIDTLQCEKCGKQAPRASLAEGWFQSGISLLLIPETSGCALASWCSEVCFSVYKRQHANPTQEQVDRLRHVLEELAAEATQ